MIEPPSMERQPSQSDLVGIVADLKQLSRGLGFDLLGIAPARIIRAQFLRDWIAQGRHGDMNFLADRIDERLNPTQILPGAQTAICVAMNYNTCTPSAVDPSGNSTGQLAKYARGQDYHELIKHKLYAIADWLRDKVPGAQTKCGVDTAPIAERDLSAQAGVGWVGKNTCIINESIGSWLFLGTVLTTLPLPTDAPAVDRCGTCTRCIDACPTRAITPYQLDARRCISYLTIEHPGEISEVLQEQMGDWLFGCDICQTVCPWNGRAPVTELLELQPRVPARINAREILKWQKEDFDKTFRRTAVKRIRLPILQRNAAIVARNSERHSQAQRSRVQTDS